MPQAGWTASHRAAAAARAKDPAERTPRGAAAMQVDDWPGPGPVTEARVTRSQARTREKFAPPLSAGKEATARNAVSSHASVSLLTPRLKSSSSSQTQQENRQPSTKRAGAPRRTSLLAIEQARSAAAPMDIDVVTPRAMTSKQVLGAYNYAKENDARLADRPTTTGRGGTGATTARAGSRRGSLKGGEAALPPSALKSSFVGGLRARQVNEDMERGGGGGDEGSGSRIMVYVRLRPMSKKEREAGARSCVKVDNNRDVYLTEMALETDYLRLKRLRGRHFAFDAAFPDDSSQQEVYDVSTGRLVEGVLEGRNASVFCYGATGAGKTHTMLGTVQSPGVMVLALKGLFASLKRRSPEGEHAVHLSYLEVYNESVRDLLSPGRPLVLREDSKLGIVAAGLTQFQASSVAEIMGLLHKGNTNRQTEPTRINETSSRSHAILQVVVEYQVRTESATMVRMGKLSLIDLAGSERSLATDSRTVRSVEGANINRSLLALSSCINALVEGKKHIPFRNSKLTQLLKDSLGGECQTAMIANLSPSNGSFGETQNTLHWADRAKEIRTKACEAQEHLQLPESQDEQAKLLLRVQNENRMLKIHLARLEQKYLSSTGVAATPATPATPHVVTYPGEPLPAVETLARGGQAKSAAEKKIWELQRTVELLEMEAEKTRRDSALREERMNASLLALSRDHSLQLKRKDEYIRTLCQPHPPNAAEGGAVSGPGPSPAKHAAPPPPPPSVKSGPSPIRCLEKILKQRAADSSANDAAAAASEESREAGGDDKSRRLETPKVGGTGASRAAPPQPFHRTSSRSAAPKPEPPPKASPRMTRTMSSRSQTTPQQSPVKTPSKNPFSKCFSPSTTEEEVNNCRKRTFWDITNSPNGLLGRSSSSTEAASGGGGAFSHLRQPGFARRRTSPEQE